MKKNTNTTIGWYEYQLDFLKLRSNELHKISQGKKITSKRSICSFLVNKSPISADFIYINNYVISRITKAKKLAEQNYINDIIILENILTIWGELGLSTTWRSDAYFSTKDMTKGLYELIDALYELISEVDPDIDTVKIDLDKKFNVELENEQYDTTDIKSLELALDELKPFAAKLEKYHVYLVYYIRKHIIPLIDALYDIYDDIEYN